MEALGTREWSKLDNGWSWVGIKFKTKFSDIPLPRKSKLLTRTWKKRVLIDRRSLEFCYVFPQKLYHNPLSKLIIVSAALNKTMEYHLPPLLTCVSCVHTDVNFTDQSAEHDGLTHDQSRSDKTKKERTLKKEHKKKSVETCIHSLLEEYIL